MTQAPRALERFIRGFPRLAVALALAIGALSLVAWFADLRWLIELVPGPKMTACTATLGVLAGIALWAVRRAPVAPRSRRVGRICALAVCTISGLICLEYATGGALDLDQLLAYVAGWWPPGRPSPQTAFAFLFLGAGLLALDRSIGGRRPADYLALAAIVVATGALLGYLFGAPALYGIVPYVGMSVPTAVVVFALGFGLLAARVEQSVIAVVIARDAGGAAARRLLGGLLTLPPIAAVLLAGAHARWYTFAFASALVLLVAIAEGSGMILSTASQLSRADAALRASEARARELVEQASDAIFIADLSGRYTEVNAAACRMLGHARAELVGKAIVDLLPPEDLPRLAAAKQRLVAGAIEVEEWRLRRSDGTYLPVEVSAKILADGRWQGIVRDISERKRAAAALARAAEAERGLSAWLQSIIDQLPEGVIVLDADGQVKAMNRTVRALALPEPADTDRWGNPAMFDVRELDQRPVPLDDLPLVRALRTGETVRDRELLLRQADGRMLPIAASAAPVRDAQQRITGAAVVVTDISERKELERMREEWVAVVAHDLRQPLNTILLSSDRLASVAADDRQRAVVERVRGAAWRLNRMIEDLLDAARIAAHQLAIEPHAVDVVGLARTMVENARLEHPSVELRLIAPERELAWADGDRVQQVLGNLISNAVKYGAPDTPIRIEVAPRDGAVELAVANEGPELSADELQRLFARFARTRQARSARIPGIGLGLYICKGLIEAHGGRIWAERRGGTTAFRFTLPRPPE